MSEYLCSFVVSRSLLEGDSSRITYSFTHSFEKWYTYYELIGPVLGEKRVYSLVIEKSRRKYYFIEEKQKSPTSVPIRKIKLKEVN